MTDNVTLPAQGAGTSTPIVETIDEGGGAQRQVITLAGLGRAGQETQLTAGQKAAAASIPVVLASDQPTAKTTPRAALTSIISVGGTPVIVVIGPINGGYITNPPDQVSQNIATAENLYLDMVVAPGSTDAQANGTTSLIFPGGSFTLQPLDAGVEVRVNAVSSGHKFTAVVW